MVAVAIGFTYQPELTAPHPGRRISTRLVPGSTARAMAGLAGLDLVVLLLVAGGFAHRPATKWVLLFPIVAVALLATNRHYAPRITLGVAREARSIIGRMAISAVLLDVVHVVRIVSLVEIASIASASVLIIRSLAYKTIGSARARGLLSERTLILGCGRVGVQLSSLMTEHPECGLKPVGFLDDVEGVEGRELPLPHYGPVSLLSTVLNEQAIDRVVVAFGITKEPETLAVIRECESTSVVIHVLPRFFELGVAVDGSGVDELWGIPLVRLRRPRPFGWATRAKRAVDVMLSGVALMLLAPLYGALALAVKASSPGGVYFRQKRVGQNGTIIEILKFRSMRVADGPDTEWKADEERMTKVGRLMRRTSLDELPQLWTVLRGDMSLVGPRPERPYFVDRFKSEIRHYESRHRLPMGLTGLAQVHGLRGDTSIEERARFDNRYIETWSLWRDLVILAQTFFAVAHEAVGTLGESEYGFVSRE